MRTYRVGAGKQALNLDVTCVQTTVKLADLLRICVPIRNRASTTMKDFERFPRVLVTARDRNLIVVRGVEFYF